MFPACAVYVMYSNSLLAIDYHGDDSSLIEPPVQHYMGYNIVDGQI